MIRVSVFYPQSDGAKFDWDYYLASHIPMVREKLGKACKGISVEKGLAGGPPGTTPTFLALCHLSFDSVDAYQAAFAPHAATIMSDIPNYSSGQPAVQVSEVAVSV
jgi:uncharacterized protein (TIGR02118 family)